MRLFNEKISGKTYATIANAEKAVAKSPYATLRYIIAVDGAGRFIVVFIGPSAMQAGVQFSGFCLAF